MIELDWVHYLIKIVLGEKYNQIIKLGLKNVDPTQPTNTLGRRRQKKKKKKKKIIG